MVYKIEPECPQCGAPVEMDELDRLLVCPYCEVRSYLYTGDYFRLVMPHNAPGRELIYAPYLRFKGAVYHCQGIQVKHRILDITRNGTGVKRLPPSLGINTQIFKLKFISPKTEGTFIRFDLDRDRIIEEAGNMPDYSVINRLREPANKLKVPPLMSRLHHRAFIGETFSIVYLPMYIENDKLFDAVVNRPVLNLNNHINISELYTSNPRWKLGLLPVICPHCGWDLEGARDSNVLTCPNCQSAWAAADNKYTRVKVYSLPGEGNNMRYLPFWKITATAKSIISFADYIRRTGCIAERDIRSEWENIRMDFWIPAFKINPKIYLNLANRITFSLQGAELTEKMPEGNVYPATLPVSEASESIKVVFANAVSTRYRKSVYEQLPETVFEREDTALVYLPFTETAMEMIQQQSSVTFFKAALRLGRMM